MKRLAWFFLALMVGNVCFLVSCGSTSGASTGNAIVLRSGNNRYHAIDTRGKREVWYLANTPEQMKAYRNQTIAYRSEYYKLLSISLNGSTDIWELQVDRVTSTATPTRRPYPTATSTHRRVYPTPTRNREDLEVEPTVKKKYPTPSSKKSPPSPPKKKKR